MVFSSEVLINSIYIIKTILYISDGSQITSDHLRLPQKISDGSQIFLCFIYKALQQISDCLSEVIRTLFIRLHRFSNPNLRRISRRGGPLYQIIDDLFPNSGEKWSISDSLIGGSSGNE
jgi:hypothetical protein